VDEDDPRSALTELRLRLYRPDPPVGAVAAYLDALARVPVAPVLPPRVIRPPRHLARRLGTAAVVIAAVAGFTTLLPVVMRAVVAASIGSPATSTPVAVPYPPTIGVPLGRLAGGAGTTGRFVAGGSRVVVSVNCTGGGTMTVRIGSQPGTELTCDSAVAALALMTSDTPLDRFTVRVVPDRTVRWTVAVGAMPRTPAPSPSS
jgi:hypothetical protein